MNPNIYEGSKGIITFTVDVSTDQAVAHLVVKRTGAIVGKFSYPERTGYNLLEKDGDNYTGYLTSDMTLNLDNEILRLDFKAFIGTTIAAQGKSDITKIEDITTKSVEKL
jgi:hypothetical protein